MTLHSSSVTTSDTHFNRHEDELMGCDGSVAASSCHTSLVTLNDLKSTLKITHLLSIST